MPVAIDTPVQKHEKTTFSPASMELRSHGSNGKDSRGMAACNVKWEHAPPDINSKLETGSATVLYCDEQGRFAVVGCVINREPGRYTT